MTSTKKIPILIIILLVNFLITSCDGCGKKKGNSLLREEKRLKNILKAQCSPDGWKNLEESFEENRSSHEKINQNIQRLLALQEKPNSLEKLLASIINKLTEQRPLSTKENTDLQSLLKSVSPLKVYPEELANKQIDDLLRKGPELLQQFSGFLNPTLIQEIRTFLNNQLDLWRNLKQQLEQKNTEENNDPNQS